MATRDHTAGGDEITPAPRTLTAVTTAQALAPGANFSEPFVLECNQERDDLDSLNAWLGENL